MSSLNKIETFIEHNFVIQYLHSNKINVRLFVDSRDVIEMSKGLGSIMNDDGDVDMTRYRSDQMLVYSLIYGGWLESVNITVPHQEELLRNFDKNRIARIHEKDLLTFWEKALDQIIGLKPGDFKKNLRPDKYVEKVAPKAEELYKANYLLIETLWHRRFKHLENSKILCFDSNDEDLVAIARSAIFRKLYSAFKLIRPKKDDEKKNLTDTMVLSILHTRLKNFRPGEAGYIPIFFDTQNLFNQVIKISGTVEEFTFKVHGHDFSIICDSQFLQYYALFRNKDQIALSMKEPDRDHFSIYQQLLSSLSLQRNFTASFLNDYSHLIEKLMQSTFFDICWVNSRESVHKFIEELIHAESRLRSQQNKDLIEDEINQLIHDIKRRAEEFVLFKDVFVRINSTHLLVVKQFTDNLGKYLDRGADWDVMNEFSLIRFSVPEQYYERINFIVKGILFEEDEEPNIDLITSVIEHVISGLKNKSAEITIPLMVFWVLGEYKMIRRLMDRFEGVYHHFSMAFLHAATIAKSCTDPEDLLKVRAILKVVNETPGNDFTKNYQTAIAASYILFHVWLTLFDGHFLTFAREPQSSGNPEIDRLFSEAIYLARTAILLLEKELAGNHQRHDRYMKSKHYYITNNKIYYITMGSKDKDFLDLADDVALLETVEGKPEFWQFRYHDTLAMYYFRKALIEKARQDLNEYQFCISQASARSGEALKGVINIEDEKFYSQLDKKIERLYPRKKDAL